MSHLYVFYVRHWVIYLLLHRNNRISLMANNIFFFYISACFFCANRTFSYSRHSPLFQLVVGLLDCLPACHIVCVSICLCVNVCLFLFLSFCRCFMDSLSLFRPLLNEIIWHLYQNHRKKKLDKEIYLKSRKVRDLLMSRGPLLLLCSC